MAHTDRSDSTARQVLHREIAGTMGLLADEHDFHAMRYYRSFTFRDHAAYLRHVEAVLRARADRGGHTTIALFDPVAYAGFCATVGIDADTAAGRSRFTAVLAARGTTVAYDGRPLVDLLPSLLDAAVRRATREHTATILAAIGPCALCGEDIGRAALARAGELLARVLDTAPDDHLHLVCAVSGVHERLSAILRVGPARRRDRLPDHAAVPEFTGVLAVGLAARAPGGLILRAGVPGRVYGWRLREHGLVALTAGEVFDAYCLDPRTGEPISPEPGVRYSEPPDLGEDSPERGHHH
ncbi:hypothetical protein AAH978_06605 [Streptomyces sp. ZYX-F-203]